MGPLAGPVAKTFPARVQFVARLTFLRRISAVCRGFPRERDGPQANPPHSRAEIFAGDHKIRPAAFWQRALTRRKDLPETLHATGRERIRFPVRTNKGVGTSAVNDAPRDRRETDEGAMRTIGDGTREPRHAWKE